jgi:hypothetical protein
MLEQLFREHLGQKLNGPQVTVVRFKDTGFENLGRRGSFGGADDVVPDKADEVW